MDRLQVDVRTLLDENVYLKSMMHDVKSKLEEEQVKRNIDAQYHRTSLNLKLCGVPFQPGEEVKTQNPNNAVTCEVVKRVCVAAHINLPQNAIDVCHRLGDDDYSPIIIRFFGKSSRYSFFTQRYKLKDITSTCIDFTKLPHVNYPPNIKRRTPIRDNKESDIFVQEHLTKYSKNLLNAAKKTLQKHFEYPGYIMNGEVRCKKSQNAKFEKLTSLADLKKILSDNKIKFEENLFEHHED